MRAIKARKIDINLLGKDAWAKTPFGKFLKWILTYGRYIIIGTEILVLLAFLSRFKLDRDLTDLADSIATKQAVILASSDLENDVRALQRRLAKIKDLEKQALLPSPLLASFDQIVPPDVVLTDFNLSGPKLSLSGTTFSLNSFSSFLVSLTNSGRFKEVALEKLSEEEMGGLKFTLSVLVMPKGESKNGL